MKNNQNGFSVVEVLLIIIVVGLMCAAGWIVYERQNKDSDDNTNMSVTKQESPTPNEVVAKSDTIDEVLEALDSRIKKISTQQTATENAKYTLETLPARSVALEIKENNEYVAKEPLEGDSKNYRLNRVTNDYEGYEEYIANHISTAKDLVSYATNELGFKEVDTHVIEGPAEKFTDHLLKKGDIYCQVEYATSTFIDISCLEM